MEGYFNVSGAHNAFDDFDIEGKKSFDMVEKNNTNFSPKVRIIIVAVFNWHLAFHYFTDFFFSVSDFSLGERPGESLMDI